MNEAQDLSLSTQAKTFQRVTGAEVPFPSPPIFLDVNGTMKGDVLEARAAAIAIVRPHWDGIVDMIRGEGYDAVLRLKDNLEQRLQQLRTRLEPLEDTRFFLEMALEAFASEAAHYGFDSNVGDSLGDKVRRRASTWWHWERWDTDCFLLATDSKGFNEMGWDIIKPARKARASESWMEVGMRAEAILDDNEELRHPLARERGMMRFRAQVVSRVLYEFEVMGITQKVDDFPERKIDHFGGHNEPSVDILSDKDRLAIIVTAHVLKNAAPEELYSRNAVIEKVMGKLEEFCELKSLSDKWHKMTVIRALSKVHAYKVHSASNNEAKRIDQASELQRMATKSTRARNCIDEDGVNQIEKELIDFL